MEGLVEWGAMWGRREEGTVKLISGWRERRRSERAGGRDQIRKKKKSKVTTEKKKKKSKVTEKKRKGKSAHLLDLLSRELRVLDLYEERG